MMLPGAEKPLRHGFAAKLSAHVSDFLVKTMLITDFFRKTRHSPRWGNPVVLLSAIFLLYHGNAATAQTCPKKDQAKPHMVYQTCPESMKGKCYEQVSSEQLMKPCACGGTCKFKGFDSSSRKEVPPGLEIQFEGCVFKTKAVILADGVSKNPPANTPLPFDKEWFELVSAPPCDFPNGQLILMSYVKSYCEGVC